MSVIYELRGKSGRVWRTGSQPLCRVCRRMSVLPRYLAPPHNLGAMDQRRTAAKEYSVYAHSRSEKNGGRSARYPRLPRGRPLSIGRGGPADAKSPPYPGAISPPRSSGDAMRPAERQDFDILARNHWKYATQISFSRKACARSGSPAARQSPSGSRRSKKPTRQEFHLGKTPSHGLSGRVDRRGRVAAGRRGRVENRQTAPRRAAAESDRRPATRLRRRRHRLGLSSQYGREGLE